MKEIRGKIVDIEGDMRSGFKWLIMDVNGERKQFCASSRMLLNAIIDGGFSKGDRIVAHVETGMLYGIESDRQVDGG